MALRQSARAVLMVSPASFAYDVQTAKSNAFQVQPDISAEKVTAHAMDEFRSVVDVLRDAGIAVIVHEGDPTDDKPSAVFPNNWISTWSDGRVITYPMATPSRRGERDDRILDQLSKTFAVDTMIDLSSHEAEERYLESTGVIVFDHLTKTAYGCISERCDEALFKAHVESLGYQPITFHAYDQNGTAIYHTNVMMGIQSTTAVICAEAITDPSERQLVLDSLRGSRDVIEISLEQMNAFCGNMLEVQNRYGQKYLALSQTAYEALSPAQRSRLATDKKLLPLHIPTLEEVGGGSVRCMLAEVFLQPLAVSQETEKQPGLLSRSA